MSGVVTRESWARDFLGSHFIPLRRHNIVALVAWIAAEGTAAKFNPLATTRSMPGATDFNSTGVKNYPTKTDGIEATWLTLEEAGHGYSYIVRRLKVVAEPEFTARAVGESGWGTDGDLLQGVVASVERDFQGYAGKPIGQ